MILNCPKCGSHYKPAYAEQTLCSQCTQWALIYQRVMREWRYWSGSGSS